MRCLRRAELLSIVICLAPVVGADAAADRTSGAGFSPDCEDLRQLHRSASQPGDTPARDAWNVLESTMRDGPDDWLADRIALSLIWCNEPEWAPLFLNLLQHSSLQRQWRAVMFFRRVEDPESVPYLERLWQEPLPDWIRADLVEALDNNLSTVHAEDCLDLLESSDIRLARAAVDVLQFEQPDGALDALLRQASDQRSPVRRETVSALGSWPQEAEPLRLLLELSRAADENLRSPAITALYEFSQRAATERLIEIANDPAFEPKQRIKALEVASTHWHPDVLPMLWALFRGQSGDGTVRDAAQIVLYNLGHDVPQPSSWDAITSSWAITLEFAEPPEGSIVAPEGDSVRCWAAPGIEGSPDHPYRLHDGVLIVIADHFISGREHWVQAAGEGCWIPFDVVHEPPTGAK